MDVSHKHGCELSTKLLDLVTKKWRWCGIFKLADFLCGIHRAGIVVSKVTEDLVLT